MNITTQRSDTGRSGVTNDEATLNPDSVNVNTFGLASRVALGQGGIYAQPLYVRGLNFGADGVHDTIFVVTMKNVVFAIDANTGQIIRHSHNPGSPDPLSIDPIGGKAPVRSQFYFGGDYQDIVGGNPTIGILSTPVIDLANQEMLLVLSTVNDNSITAPGATDAAKVAAFQYILYAIDLITLQPKPNRSVVVSGSVSGTGYKNSKYYALKPPNGNNGPVRQVGNTSVVRTRFFKKVDENPNPVNVGVDVVDATGIGTLNPQVQFNAIMQLQRPGLLLVNGVVYIAFGSRGDFDPWHGWIFAYDAATMTRLDVLCTTANGAEGGIWQAGQGLIAGADGSIYAGTGNGDSEQPPGGPPGTPNMAESFLKITLAGGKFQIVGWYDAFDDLTYTPPDSPNPNVGVRDDDLGASAPVLLPDGRIAGGGKDGYLYLIDSDQIIQNAADNQRLAHPDTVVQQCFIASYNFGRGASNNVVDNIGGGTRLVPTFLGNGLIQDKATHHIHGAPVVWQTSNGTAFVFVWGENDVARAFTYSSRLPSLPFSGGFTNEGAISAVPIITGTDKTIQQGFESARGMITASNEDLQRSGMPGGFLSLSWDGANDDSAILWGLFPSIANGNRWSVAGELAAFDASTFDVQSNFSRMTCLWRSGQNPADSFGKLPKFCCPTVADGKVFVPAGDGSNLVIYGLKPATAIGGGYNLQRDAGTPAFGGPSGLTLNGSACIGTPVPNFEGSQVTPIVLTQLPSQIPAGQPFQGFTQYLIPTFHAGSVFCTTPVDVTNLQTTFTVHLGFLPFLPNAANNMADGFTFTVQAAGPNALGSSGSGLGYAIDPSDQTNTGASIPRSFALAFNIVDNTLSLWRDGKVGDPGVALITNFGTQHNIALNRGNPIRVNVIYNNALKVLTVSVRDLATADDTGPLAIPNIDLPGFLNLGVPALAYFGFTGGTGAKSSEQKILDWSTP